MPGDGTPPSAAIPVDEFAAHDADREQRIRALTERWHAIKRAREQAAERKQRTRATIGRWHAVMRAQGRTALRGGRVRARIAACLAWIRRVIASRAGAASVRMGSQCADQP